LPNEDIDLEQGYVSMLYGRLDDLRERASGRLTSVLRQTGGTHQARTEREAFSAMYSQQLAQFDAAENGLCFGRLDFRDGDRRYNRPHRDSRRFRGLRAAADGLARVGGAALLPGHRRLA